MADLLHTVGQAASRLQIHPSTLRWYLREGRVEGMKLGRVWRAAEGALLKSISATQKTATPKGRMPKAEAESRAAAFSAALRDFDEACKREGITGLDIDELFREMREDRTAFLWRCEIPPRPSG